MPQNTIPGNLLRYKRQISFAPVGLQGQEKFRDSHVLLCGCGALGSLVADILVRAGIGRVRIVDCDRVERENLHRQFLFDEDDAKEKRYKVDAAAVKLRAANSEVVLEPIRARLADDNADALFEGIRLVVDGTDNFRTRFLLNATAVRHKIPFVTAGVLGANGQILSIVPGRTPCLACLFPDRRQEYEHHETRRSDDEDEAISRELDHSGLERSGILAPTVVFAAALEAMETFRLLLDPHGYVNRSLFAFDLWNRRFTGMNTEISSHAADAPSRCLLCGYSGAETFA